MDVEEFADRILAEYDGCSEPTAERIAEQARRYGDDMDAGKTVDDWLSFMRDSDQEDAVAAWNWAVGYVDPSHWEGGNPYKLDR